MSYVINPNTNRHIKVGGSAYRKLMRQQMIKEQKEAGYEQDEDVYGTNTTKHQKKKKTVGKRRRIQPSQEEVSRYTAKAATKAFTDNMGMIADKAAEVQTEEDTENLQKCLEKLILNEMMKGVKKEPKKRHENLKKSVANSKKIMKPVEEEYYIEESEED